MKIESTFLNDNFVSSLAPKKEVKENAFSDLLGSISNDENALNEMKTQYLNGERDDIDNILVEGQKLNLQLNFALEVRNNLVDMVKQLTNMQI